VSVGEKVVLKQSDEVQGVELPRTHVDASLARSDIKTGSARIFREESASVFRMLCRWCPAYSGRDPVLGFLWELRELVILMLREKGKSLNWQA